MNSEEFMKAMDTLPTIPTKERKALISAYESIDVKEFNEVVNRYKTLPNYDMLIKENNELAYKWNALINRLFSKFNETQETFYLDIVQMMEEIDRSCRRLNR